MDPALWELLRAEETHDPPRPVEAIIRLVRPGIEIPGVRVVARFGSIATCRIAAADVVAVRAHRQVVSLKAARRLGAGRGVGAEPTDPADPTGPRRTDVRRPPGLAVTGAGVVVGCVDWGADIDSRAFRRPPPGDTGAGVSHAGGPTAGGTRFLALWDQRDRAGGEPPRPYGYGTVHDRAAIDRALRHPRPFEALGYHPAASDRGRGTHGTHVLDIAAGNGRAGGPVGIAPEADLVFVHLADRDTGGLANLGDSVRLLEAIDFIRRTAGDRPCVINTSVGRHGGPHDGTTLAELAIGHLLATTPGLVVVKSTGNYVRSRAHASGRLAVGETRSLEFVVDPADATPNELEIWYDGDDELVVRLTPPGHPATPPVALGQRADITVGGHAVGRVYHRAHDPNNGANHIDAFLRTPGCSGTWTVTLTARRVRDGRFHAWLERDDFCPPCQTRFVDADSVRTSTTGTLANGHLDLTVGAFDGHDPARPPAAFSSAGPTRDGRPKPDLAAAGVAVLAARSAPADAATSPGLLVRKSGTSMAAPHVTGAVALCLELGLRLAGRPLTAREVRSLVLSTCDPPRSPDPERRLGRGYLNITTLLAATRTALATANPPPKESVMDTDDIPLLSAAPATAYREILYRPGGAAARRFAGRYAVLARPGRHPVGAPEPGDVLLEVTLGRLDRGRSRVLDDPLVLELGSSPLMRPGQLLLRPATDGGAGGPVDDAERTEVTEVDRLIDDGQPEDMITNAVFFTRNPSLVGTRLRAHTRAAREWLTIRDAEVRPAVRRRLQPGPVDPSRLATFLSQYESDERVPATVRQRFLTGPPLLSLGRSLRDRALHNWLSGKPPLTTRTFFASALELTGDAPTAVLLCHNVARSFAKSGDEITWRNLPTEGDYTDGQKSYRAQLRHPRGRLRFYYADKGREVTSIFYLLFDPRELGTEDPGDWYHFFVTASMTALSGGRSRGSTSRGRGEDLGEDRGSDRLEVVLYPEVIAERLADLERQLADPELGAVPGYRGWVLANVLSFLEGGHHGGDFVRNQSDVEREGRVHLRGAAFGLGLVGGRPGPTWRWHVPRAMSISRLELLTGFAATDKTAQVWAPDAKPRPAEDVGSTTSATSAEDEPRPPDHVVKARTWWRAEFGKDPVLRNVLILDYASVPSAAVLRAGFDAWTNSATRVYVTPTVSRDDATLERMLRHEARHVIQFARTGRPTTYEQMVRFERVAYGEDLTLLRTRSAELTKALASVDQQVKDTDATVALLDSVSTDAAKVAKDRREDRFRSLMVRHGLLPAHTRLVDLYVPPKDQRNPSAQEADQDALPQIGWDAEQGLALPRVTEIRFRNAGTSDADNTCAICPTPLGVGVGGTASNAMELRWRITGHRSGMEYDITRTRRDSFWQRTAGVWTRLGSNAMGTNDDHHDADEALAPRGGFIYVVDRPGYPGLAVPAPAQALGGGTLWPAAVTSAAAQDVVLRYSFAEWVIARHRGDGIPWTRLELPALRDGSPRQFFFWRCVIWISGDGAGNLVLDAARSRIERGSFSAAILNAAP